MIFKREDPNLNLTENHFTMHIKQPILVLFAVIAFVLNTYSQPGAGKSIKFNGSSQYVDCGIINLSGSAITLQGWVKVSAFKSASPYISSLIGTEQPGSTALVRFGDATVAANKVQFVLKFGSTFSKLASNSTLNTNTWYHIAATYDGSSMKIYINGILDASMSVSGSFTSYDSFELARNYSNDRILNGEMDEASVFKAALSQSTIREWMCKKINATHPNYASLEGYWPLNEGLGSTTSDLSGNGYNGTITGSPLWKNSGAAIGDASIQTYATSISGLGLAHPNGDSLAVVPMTGNYQGLHIYRVDSAPYVTSAPSGVQYIDTTRYWGVFPVGSMTYDATYFYNGNQTAQGLLCNLSLAKRTDGSAASWAPQIPDTVSYSSQTMTFGNTGRSEIVLAVSQGGPHSFNYNVSEPSCNGLSDGNAQVIVSGGLAPYSYAWSTGSSADTCGSVPTGYVSITITDANNCQSSDSVLVTQPAVIGASANIISATCADTNNGKIILNANGGTGPYSYAWDDPNTSTSSTVSNLFAQVYNVTITDANGCAGSFDFTVGSIGPDPMPFIGNDSTFCEGTVYGITTSGSGGPFTQYQWSNGTTAPILVVNQSGTYSITVSNAAGCSGSASVTLTYVAPVQVTIPATTLGIGQATIDAGAGFAAYLWNTGATTQTITVQQSGNFWVKTLDTNGCKSADTTNVLLAPNGINTISTNGISIYPNPVKDELHINLINGAIQEIQLLDLTGKIVASAKSATTLNLQALTEGVYFVRIYTSDQKTQTFKIQKS